ncbi:hypothetical protein [Weissella cibaria]|uniref:hypothetical protein n=1 Tax=Weissella cibaria TaxID=137591 RepID=UPI00223AE4B6|nr:hypothetical protein [Weissella cibaria]MCT0001146.1 hypothetical protein [Weissella cibaria]MCT0955653.1 hypothetical protein [Weissella cibaria]
MKYIKSSSKKLLHHPNTMTWLFISTMVAIMSTYNTIIRYGVSEIILEKVFTFYPLIVIFVYLLRTYVTLPLVLKLHKYLPSFITNNIPNHISVPTLVITFNVSIMMVWFTETHRHLYPQFISGYLGNWAKTFFVAVPVFFFIVRPTLLAIFKKLKQTYPLS